MFEYVISEGPGTMIESGYATPFALEDIIYCMKVGQTITVARVQ